MAADGTKEIEFFGKITAAATHEMKNVLAIIKESAGLMEDLMGLSPEIPDALRDKCQNTLSVIRKQIQRGVTISDHLNRFAHSTDVPSASIDLNNAAAEIACLTERFVKIKNILLEVEPSNTPMMVQASPVSLLMALFTGVHFCLNLLAPGSRILIKGEESQNGFALSFLLKGKDIRAEALDTAFSASEAGGAFRQIATASGGTVQFDADDPCIRLFFQKSFL